MIDFSRYYADDYANSFAAFFHCCLLFFRAHAKTLLSRCRRFIADAFARPLAMIRFRLPLFTYVYHAIGVIGEYLIGFFDYADTMPPYNTIVHIECGGG